MINICILYNKKIKYNEKWILSDFESVLIYVLDEIIIFCNVI